MLSRANRTIFELDYTVATEGVNDSWAASWGSVALREEVMSPLPTSVLESGRYAG
jgi:hypothetical protein